MSVEWEPTFEAKRVARAQAAGDDAEFFSGCENLVPNAGAGGLVRRDIDFETVFGSIAGAAHQNIFQSADRPARYPIKLHRAQIGIGQLLKNVDALRALNRDLGEVIGEMLDRAVELARVVAHPVEVLFARAGVDHEEILVLAQAVDNYVVDERSFG